MIIFDVTAIILAILSVMKLWRLKTQLPPSKEADLEALPERNNCIHKWRRRTT
jgi:hypothetical protein